MSSDTRGTRHWRNGDIASPMHQEVIPEAPPTTVPCPAASLPCTACGAEPGTEHIWVSVSKDEAWRVAHGHEPRSRNSSKTPTQRKT